MHDKKWFLLVTLFFYQLMIWHLSSLQFIDNIFKRNSGPTIGSLDLGGASTQIAFEPNPADVNVNSTGMSSLQLYGKQYNVYSHSFLCYGKEQATFRNLAMLVMVS